MRGKGLNLVVAWVMVLYENVMYNRRESQLS